MTHSNCNSNKIAIKTSGDVLIGEALRYFEMEKLFIRKEIERHESDNILSKTKKGIRIYRHMNTRTNSKHLNSAPQRQRQ